MGIQMRIINKTRPFIALIIFLILEGCGVGGSPPDVSLQLAVKANNFMNVAALLFAQGPEFWGQGLRSIYYSALTLARLKDVNAFSDSTEKFHVKVWSLSPLPIRNYFARDMKKVRTRYDYDLDTTQSEATSDLISFLQNGVTPFENLLAQANKNIVEDYRHCSNIPSTCKYCRDAKVNNCLKKSAATELEATRNTLLEILARNSELTANASSCETNMGNNSKLK